MVEDGNGSAEVTSGQKVCRPYGSSSRDYADAFARFLACTDQKTRARDRILAVLETHPCRTFVDVGPGDGLLTSWVARDMETCHLIEPNSSLAALAQSALPNAQLYSAPIQEVSLPPEADVVLVSHVLFYIEAGDWPDFLAQCASFLVCGGLCLVLMQNRATDYMKMLDSLGLPHDHLDRITNSEMAANAGFRIDSFETIPSRVCADTEDDLVTIGAFMLNCVRGWQPLTRQELLELTFSCVGQRTFPMFVDCSQDLLVLRKR